jgi:hypothetical protein
MAAVHGGADAIVGLFVTGVRKTGVFTRIDDRRRHSEAKKAKDRDEK